MKTDFMDKTYVHILLIVVLGLFAYSNTFHASFHLDDLPVIVENPIIKDLRYFIEPSKAEDFKGHFEYKTFKRRYIGYLTFALNYRVHGLDVMGYHLVNISIHIINAILVYFLVVLTFKTPYFKVSVISASVSNQPDQLNPSTIKPLNYLPLFIALLFVVHPIQTQAVTYIFQRVASLATMFYLLSVVMYIKYRIQNTEVRIQNTPSLTLPPRGGGLGWGAAKVKKNLFSALTFYLLSIFSAVLAMKTKQIAFMLPVMITLYEFMFFAPLENNHLSNVVHGSRITVHGSRITRRILYLIPLLLTMLIIPLSLINIDKPAGELIGDVSEVTKGNTSLSRWEYLLTEFRVIVTYIRLLFLPINQNLDYDYPVYRSFLNPQVFLSFLFLLSLFGFAAYLLYRSRFIPPFDSPLGKGGLRGVLPLHPTPYTLHATRLISFGIFWFFINLFLESSIIPLNNVIFEHRLYLPSIGAIMAFSAAIFYVLQFIVHSSRFTVHGSRFSYLLRPTYYCLLSTIIIVLSIVTYQRNAVWKDEFTLWKDVVNKSPNKAMGHHELGFAYQSKGFINKADEQHQIAIKVAYQSKGYSDEKVIEQYQIILRSTPYDPAVHNNLGLAYRYKGLTDKGIEHLQIALKLKPDFIAAHVNLGNAYISKGLTDKAIEQYKIALRLKADIPEAYYNLGNAYFSKGMIDNAIENYERAINLDPDDPDAHIYLGFAYLRKELSNKAKEHFRMAETLMEKTR